MKYNNTIKRIKNLEKNFEILSKKLAKLKILKSKTGNYILEDKKEVVFLRESFIIFFDEIKNLFKEHKYRKFFIIRSYNNLIITRYLAIFYYNCLVKIIGIFGKHEAFLRSLLNDNFRKSYGFYARYIYKAKYVNLINTPNIFMYSAKIFINEELYFMMGNKAIINTKNRINLDYTNIYFYIKKRVENVVMVLSKYSGKIIAKTRFSSRNRGLITKKNIDSYLKIAKIGDIILTRGNWNASNGIIPGFWKHMSMYIGDGKDVVKLLIKTPKPQYH